ncbi:MAG: TetM/TetW/TetO/TetS family tetracycline resistance ribosomal protection protein, partial [Lachnospiraceae bacterium]|nr:TetM/TetW/TetO/TetS family tetracycline resistance ribosomal protection protein [Lachnospiraceae bacterium]
MNYSAIGILAHVDAGKTTLSESLMYATGKLNNPGRVDKGDAFLDTDPLEKERGITIFSKQAILEFEEFTATLLDTPGHVDFSAETERTLSVLDAAILVISGPDKVQSHTRTLWHLLRTYNIPTLIFVNKMDQEGTDREEILKSLTDSLSDSCIDFTDFKVMPEELKEQLATCDEELLEKYLESGDLSVSEVKALFSKSLVFPVFFGAALKNEGVKEFMDAISIIMTPYSGGDEFAARVFKISRDDKEERLTHIKITGGELNVRELIADEKVTGIRVYDGVKFTQEKTAYKGQIVAITGLDNTYPGQGLGAETGEIGALLTPVLSYSLILPKDINKSEAVSKLIKLSEEQPDLSIEYDSETHYTSISLMGDVQTEVLKRRILERFGFEVEFGEKRIIYKETITDTVEGVGHFEPLRHYAEAHILMEPLPQGEGLIFDTDCSEDILDKNWQRLILTHLKE